MQGEAIARVRNFAEKKVYKCMECGNVLDAPKDLYTRRFCSVQCKAQYFERI